MGEYKNENWIKKGKKWVNIRKEIETNFWALMVNKWENIRMKIGLKN